VEHTDNVTTAAEPRTGALVSTPEGGVSHECMAFLPDYVVDEKVNGFITACQAKVLDVSEGRVRLEVGRGRRRLFLPRRIQTLDEVPVELELRLKPNSICVQGMTHMVVTLQPRAKSIDPEVLRERYRQVIQDLRAYFMAQNLERRFAERLAADFVLSLWPILPGKHEADWAKRFAGETINISKNGMAIHLEQEIDPGEVVLEYEDHQQRKIVTARGEIVRADVDKNGMQICGVRVLETTADYRCLTRF